MTARARKRLFAIQLCEDMERDSISKKQLAAKLQAIRSQLDCMLDPDNTSITLESLERLAFAVGGQLRIELT